MILLDTQSLIWWTTDPSRLSLKAEKVIEKEFTKGKVLVSSVSIWEICLLIKKNKIQLAVGFETWISELEMSGMYEFVPLDNSIAAKSVLLPDFDHKDPADRFIIATAIEYGATLVTSDKKILKYPHVQTCGA